MDANEKAETEKPEFFGLTLYHARQTVLKIRSLSDLAPGELSAILFLRRRAGYSDARLRMLLRTAGAEERDIRSLFKKVGRNI